MFCVFGHKSPTVTVQANEFEEGTIIDMTNPKELIDNNEPAPDFLRMTPPGERDDKQKFQLPQDNNSSGNNSLDDNEYDLNPPSTFQFFKN